MRLLKIMIIAGLLTVLSSTDCLAGGNPNYSGRWLLDPSASKMSFKPEAKQTLDIAQKDSTLDVLETTGTVKQKHGYTLDGVKHKIDVEGVVTVELAAKWQGSSIQITSDSGRMKSTETWQLEDNGKTLSINRTSSGIVSRQETFKYRKQ